MRAIRVRKRRPVRAGTRSNVRDMLMDMGFERSHLEHAPNAPTRAVFKKGIFKILGETSEQPYWTVQRLNWGKAVDWYVDIPLSAGAEVLQSFLVALETGHE